jgi:hypothetical protein
VSSSPAVAAARIVVSRPERPQRRRRRLPREEPAPPDLLPKEAPLLLSRRHQSAPGTDRQKEGPTSARRNAAAPSAATIIRIVPLRGSPALRGPGGGGSARTTDVLGGGARGGGRRERRLARHSCPLPGEPPAATEIRSPARPPARSSSALDGGRKGWIGPPIDGVVGGGGGGCSSLVTRMVNGQRSKDLWWPGNLWIYFPARLADTISYIVLTLISIVKNNSH